MRVRFLNAGQSLEPLPPGAELVSQRVFPLSFPRAGFPPLPTVPLKVDGVTGHFWGEKHFPGPVANIDRPPDEVTGMNDVLDEHGAMEQVGEIEAWRAPNGGVDGPPLGTEYSDWREAKYKLPAP